MTDQNRRRSVGAGLAALVIAAYANSAHTPFVFDDRTVVRENPSIRHLADFGAVLHPPVLAGTAGRPLANLTFALNYALGGENPFGYHLVNGVFHLLAVLTLWGVARRTFLGGNLPPRVAARAEVLAAGLAAWWAVHPLNTSVVTYVSQRTEGMMGLCYLVTLYCLLRSAAGNRAWWAAAIAAGAAGMACKEVMLTAPVAVLLFDSVFVAGSLPEAWRRRWPLHAGLAASWLLLAFLLVTSQPAARGVGAGAGVTRGIYLMTEAPVVLRYLKVCLWPHPLIFDNGPVFVTDFSRAWLPGLGVLGLAAACAFAWRRHRAAAFCGLWFFLLLAPTSSLVPVFHQPYGENRLYLPSLGVLSLATAGLGAALGRRVLWALGPIVAACLVLTIARNRDFRTETRLWQTTVRAVPGNSRAIFNLGCAEMNAGDMPDAVRHFQDALRISPEYADVHHNLGVAYSLQKNYPAAEAELRQAVALDPDRPRQTLGKVLSAEGRLTEANAEFQRDAERLPDDADARYDYGDNLLSLGRSAAARPELEAAVRLNPGFAAAYNDLGCISLGEGRYSEARSELETALRLKPDYAEAWSNLGNAALGGGDNAGAVTDYRQALRFKPDYAEADTNLGTALGNLGRLDEALAADEQAVRLNPRQPVARYNLGNVLASLGRKAEAIEQFQAALRLAPNLQPARAALARLRK